MTHFMELLERRAQEIDSRLCVGLDPHPYLVGEDATPEALAAWTLDLVEQTAPYALCFKLNVAFFEAFGAAGARVIEEIAPRIRALAPLLLDAKRGDIASTAAAYAQASFERQGGQAITLSPYLGFESLEPFLAYPEAGFFVLCHTSNPGADQLQSRVGRDGLPLDEFVAHSAHHHPESARIGLVVGATQVDALRRIRQRAPEAWLLCPGIGAQGGSLTDAVQAGWGDKGRVLISASRSIAAAQDPAQEARLLRDAIRAAAPAQPAPQGWTAAQRALARGLIRSGCVLFGEFTLKSGLQSPVYVDLRRLTGQPALYRLAIDAYHGLLARLEKDGLAALPLAGLPLAAPLALEAGLPMAYPRPPKKHGTGASIEGGVPEGARLVLVDDLATRGASALEALPVLRAAGYTVRDLLVLIDRQSGARERLAAQGVALHAVFGFGELLDLWLAQGLIEAAQHRRCVDFLQASQGGPA